MFACAKWVKAILPREATPTDKVPAIAKVFHGKRIEVMDMSSKSICRHIYSLHLFLQTNHKTNTRSHKTLPMLNRNNQRSQAHTVMPSLQLNSASTCLTSQPFPLDLETNKKIIEILICFPFL